MSYSSPLQYTIQNKIIKHDITSDHEIIMNQGHKITWSKQVKQDNVTQYEYIQNAQQNKIRTK